MSAKQLLLFCVLLLGSSFASASQLTYRMTQKGAAGCLAKAVAEEANTESLQGKRKVVAVVVNRAVRENAHVCTIIKQPRQFSWVSDKVRWNSLASADENRNIVVKMTSEALARNHTEWYSGITHFYAHRQVAPKWASKMVCKRDGEHTFCGEKR